MKESNKKTDISNARTLDDIATFWENNSLADHWDETKKADFKVRAKRRHRITIDPDIYDKIIARSQTRGVLPETLINLWLAEKVKEPEMTI